MEVYRITREKFASHLSGKGAAIKGARWNSAGIELIYTASNRSLAMAEVAVHLTLATLPSDFVIATIFIPDDISPEKIVARNLPTDWNEFPHRSTTQIIGDKFVTDGNYCVLQIPSVVTQGDFNFLINPNHTDIKRIKIISVEKFPFDHRLFK